MGVDCRKPTSYPANTPETDKVHTWDISTYSVPISSSYTAESGNANYYTLTLTAQVEAQLQADGSMHYTLKLPDVEQMTAADGSTVTHTDFTITNMAVFIANVQKTWRLHQAVLMRHLILARSNGITNDVKVTMEEVL
ncbi:MAG: hypothetical protein V8R46_04160 [Eubacterium ramulus]